MEGLGFAMLQLVSSYYGLPPLPPGFMRLLDTRGREGDVPCLADSFMPASGVYQLDVFGDGRVAFVAHPDTWAELGAENLAAAHLAELGAEHPGAACLAAVYRLEGL